MAQKSPSSENQEWMLRSKAQVRGFFTTVKSRNIRVLKESHWLKKGHEGEESWSAPM